MNLIKNFPIQEETEEENRKIVGDELFIDKKLAELEDYVECKSIPKAHKIS